MAGGRDGAWNQPVLPAYISLIWGGLGGGVVGGGGGGGGTRKRKGGVGGGIQRISWDGDILWTHEVSNNDYQHHHDVEPLPNGNVLIIAWERKTASEAYALGREEINNPLNELINFFLDLNFIKKN